MDLPNRSIFLRLLRWSLTAGAVYDLVFAALLLAAPELPERLLGIPGPGQPVYLWLLAVLLGMLAAFYGLAAFDPVSYKGNILVAIAGRAAAAVVLAAFALDDPALRGLHAVAAADAAFAAVHAGLFWKVRGMI